MTVGMTTSKIAISLPGTLVARAKRAVRAGRARSVSAYVASALEEKAKLDELGEMLDEMLAKTGGPLALEEQITADKALGLEPERSPGRR